jgi:hypothetical protein
MSLARICLIPRLGLSLAYATTACGETSAVEAAGTFYLSGTVTSAATGQPFEAEIDVNLPLGVTVAHSRANAAGRYEVTFVDTRCRKDGSLDVVAYASGGGYYPASGRLPCAAKGSPYVIDLTMVLRQ